MFKLLEVYVRQDGKYRKHYIICTKRLSDNCYIDDACFSFQAETFVLLFFKFESNLNCLYLIGSPQPSYRCTVHPVLEFSPIASQFATRKVGNCDSS